MMTQEIWKPIIGYEGLYEVSNLAQVRGLDRTVPHVRSKTGVATWRGRIKKPRPMVDGRLFVTLHKDGDSETIGVAVLVARAFVDGYREGLNVCHRDGDSLNDAPSNLYFGTQKQNMADRLSHGRTMMGAGHHEAKLTDQEVIAIRKLRGKKTQQKIADQFGVRQATISSIQRGQTWRHIDVPA